MIGNGQQRSETEVFAVSDKELVKRLCKAGWTVERISGSHHTMKKDGKSVSIPVHGTHDVPAGLLHDLLRDTDLK